VLVYLINAIYLSLNLFYQQQFSNLLVLISMLFHLSFILTTRNKIINDRAFEQGVLISNLIAIKTIVYNDIYSDNPSLFDYLASLLIAGVRTMYGFNISEKLSFLLIILWLFVTTTNLLIVVIQPNHFELIMPISLLAYDVFLLLISLSLNDWSIKSIINNFVVDHHKEPATNNLTIGSNTQILIEEDDIE